MNATTWTIYREYLDRTEGDKAAAASLTLADALQATLELRQPDPATPSALTVAEAAQRLKVATNTVYDMVERGELRHHRIGRTIRILPADIDAYQKQGTEATRPRSQQGRYHFDL
jgi:excisionase family DNA binding protein